MSYCVSCGRIIPEGRMVCPNCENGQSARISKEKAIKEIEEYIQDADKAIGEDEDYIRGWKSGLLAALEVVMKISTQHKKQEVTGE